MPSPLRPPAPNRGTVAALAAALAEGVLLLLAVEAALLMFPAVIRWADFTRTVHLRTLAPFLLLCLVARWLSTPRYGKGPDTVGRCFGLAIAAVAATTALSTALAVAPQVSFWGDRSLTTGLLSVVAWLVMAGTAASVLRTWVQVERLVLILLLAAFGAAWYGVAQRFAWDALWPFIVETVIDGSTLGNPVFFGSLMALTLPIGLAWWWATARFAARPVQQPGPARTRRGAGRRAGGWSWLLALIAPQALFALWLVVGRERADAGWYLPAVLIALMWLVWSATAGAGGLQPALPGRPVLLAATGATVLLLALALVTTQARGALLGASVGVVFLVLWLARPTWRRWVAALVPSAGMLLAVVFIALAPAVVALVPQAAAVPVLSRLTSVESRQHVWQMAVRLLVEPPAVLDEHGAKAVLRLVVGYGPDTVRLISEPVYPQSVRNLEAGAFINDVHNAVLQELLTVGLLGTAAWLGLLATVIWAGIRAYRRADERQRILLGGIFAGLAAYAVEQMTGPAYPPVRTLAWLLAGAVVGLARGPAEAGAAPARGAAAAGDRAPGASPWWPLGYAALTFAAALALPPGDIDHLARTATGWWAWSLVGLGALAVFLVPPAERRLTRGVALAGVVLVVGGTLWGSQALRPLVAERLHSASTGAAQAGDLVPATGLAADARATWPLDERYDFELGMALIQLAGARQGRLPQRLPQPTPPPAPFEPPHLARATPEQMLDWGIWLVERAAARQPLEFEYPLGRARTYRALAELLGSAEARIEARRSLAVAQRLSPTQPRVVQFAEQLGPP